MNADSIQSMGGKARDAALSDEQKQQIARMGAAARWSDKPIRAIRKGNFKEQFGIDVDCYVLDDHQKTAAISQRGMGRSIGLSDNGSAFPRFLAVKSMSGIVGVELMSKITQPIKFQWGTGGANQPPPSIIHGLDSALLIDLCRAIVRAESQGKLPARYARIAAQAHVILGASAKSGIKHLVYALTGYNPSADEVIAAFKMYVQEEAKKYEKEFPNELYAQWQRLYQIPVPLRGKPWNFKHLTVKHIYYPLAQSNGKILQLVRALKLREGDRKKKLFQFLSEIGARALRIQLGRVLEMSESSRSKGEYEQKIIQRFGGQQELDFLPPIPAPATPEKDIRQIPLGLEQ